MKTNNKKNFHRYDKNALKNAVEEVKNGSKLRETCRKYGIPKSTVQDRIIGRVSSSVMGPDPFLTIEIENKIVKWIQDLSRCGFPINKRELFSVIQKIVKTEKLKTPFKDGKPGQKWYSGFMRRHSSLSLKNAEALEKYRSQVTEEFIRSWFKELIDFLDELNISDILKDPSRMLNADESGFSLCPKTGKLLGIKGRDLQVVKKGNSKENLTVLLTFTADGRLCPPLVVFPYVKPPRALVESIPDEWILGKTDSGWMKSDVFYEYVANTLDKWLTKNKVQRPVLFLVDGHKSHMSLDLSKFCHENQIILYALPPNATHLIQPADVAVFKPLKEYWRTEVREWQAKNENRVVTKMEFCGIFEIVLKHPNLPVCMRNGFKACGLYPFNPNAVNYKKCVQNILENVSEQNRDSSITLADVNCAEKVISKLRPELARQGICADTIIGLLRSLFNQKDEGTFNNNNSLLYTAEEIDEMDMVFLNEIDSVQSSLSNESTRPVIIQDIILNSATQQTEEIISHDKEYPQETYREDLEETITNEETNNPEEIITFLRFDDKNTENEKNVTQGENIVNQDINETFETHLTYPQPLPKNTKKRQREKTPSAISSKAWRKYYEDKLKVQEEKENKKRRKNIAVKKKDGNPNSNNTLTEKTSDHNNNQNSIAENSEAGDTSHGRLKQKCGICEEELESDTELENEKNVGCDFCPRWFHLGCTKFTGLTYNQVSNLDFTCDFCDFT